eukprot:TRINITY_DN20218_c0_g1_i1.p1 TRINITY_DN20218_c0_g1~~TRINITY_DN20218_c0_g1_i1.p1  ORF type:complete len:213 (+),score=57.53 TRINITY_DN20218_c0_g1_i1:46-684(+)
MGGNVGKIAEEVGISEDQCKKDLQDFKVLAKKFGEKFLTKPVYLNYNKSPEAGTLFDALCPLGKMTEREFVMAKYSGKEKRPSTAEKKKKPTSSSSSSGFFKKKPPAGGNAVGGVSTSQSDAATEREKRAAAAEARLDAANRRGVAHKSSAEAAEDEHDRKIANIKADKIASIRNLLHSLGETEPFGLCSMPPEKLSSYQRSLEQRKAALKR